MKLSKLYHKSLMSSGARCFTLRIVLGVPTWDPAVSEAPFLNLGKGSKTKFESLTTFHLGLPPLPFVTELGEKNFSIFFFFL